MSRGPQFIPTHAHHLRFLESLGARDLNRQRVSVSEPTRSISLVRPTTTQFIARITRAGCPTSQPKVGVTNAHLRPLPDLRGPPSDRASVRLSFDRVPAGGDPKLYVVT